MANDPGFLPPVLSQPLAARIDSLPRILAGPIIRKVDASSVTVWVALRTPDLVGLTVRPLNSLTPVLTAGFTAPVKLGERLYVIAITASAPNPVLSPTVLYAYNLQFRPTGTTQTFTLHTPGYWIAGTPSETGNIGSDVAAQFSYGGIGDPCFCLPPDDPLSLRILHGSCRKAHADSVDGLATVDDVLTGLNGESPANAPAITLATRPHQLILTGDQIYADDVAHILLGMLTDAASALIGVPELIPLLAADGTDGEVTRFGPITRQDKISKEGGLTTTAGYSHLISFGEFAAMYLFAYSDVLWPKPLPTFEELFRIAGPQGSQPAPRRIPRPSNTRAPSEIDNPSFTACEAQRPALVSFQASLFKVRRALANMPTYMIFDDHEITDDWFMNRRFCERVLSNRLGPRIIQNGMAAYALFQGWGNVGSATGAGDVRPAVTAFQDWQTAHYPASGDQFDALKKVLGMPVDTLAAAPGAQVVQLPLAGTAVKWHYSLAWGGHELIVVDSRTRRGYPARPLQNPALIAEGGQAAQVGIPLPPELEQKISIVVVPGPVMGGVPFAEEFQHKAKTEDKVFDLDVEVWRFDPTGFESLLSNLAARGATRSRRYVILSGDVHYGFAHRFQYWAPTPLTDPTGAPAAATFAMMTSSALKNETGEGIKTTRTFHRTGFVTTDPGGTRRTNTRLAFNRRTSDPVVGNIPIATGAHSGQTYFIPVDRSLAYIENLFSTAFIHTDTPSDLRFIRPPTAIAISEFLHSERTRNITVTQVPDKPDDLPHRLTVVAGGVVETVLAYFNALQPGAEVVGVNNVGFIRFETRKNKAGVDSLWAIQELRWWPGTPEQAYKKQSATPYLPPDSTSQFAVDLTVEAAPTFPSV